MKFRLLAAICVLMVRPWLVIAQPTTAPAIRNPFPDAGLAKLLILPFEPIGEDDRRPWLSQAIQQTLQAEVAKLGVVDAIPASTTARKDVSDPTAAITAGKVAGARYVIFGFYQVIDPDLRIIGQILDVQTGRTVGGLKTTGTLRDLFAMEDALAAQARRQIPRIVQGPPATAPATEPAAAAPPPGIPLVDLSDGLKINLASHPRAEAPDPARDSREKIRNESWDDYNRVRWFCDWWGY